MPCGCPIWKKQLILNQYNAIEPNDEELLSEESQSEESELNTETEEENG